MYIKHTHTHQKPTKYTEYPTGHTPPQITCFVPLPLYFIE